MTTLFHPGDIIVMGPKRSRRYLVVSVNRLGGVEARALSGTLYGCDISGTPPQADWAKVGCLDDIGVCFTGKLAYRLHIKAVYSARRALGTFPSPDYYSEKMDARQLSVLDALPIGAI